MQYASLRSYFLSEDSPTSQNNSEFCGAKRFKRLQTQFENPLTEVYLFFYSSVMPLFTHPNKMLQHEDPCFYIIMQELNKFMVNLSRKFIELHEISTKPVLEIDPRKQKDPRNIYIGLYTKNLLNKLQEQGDISQRKFDSFLEAVRCFYYDTFVYAKEKLPLTDDLLKHSFFVDFTKRATAAIENKFFFVEKFELNFSASQLNELDNQFLQYQLLQDKDIPQSVWDKATIVDEGDNTKYYQMDVLWGHISKIKTCFDRLQFNLLFKVAKLVLVLPHFFFFFVIGIHSMQG